MTRSRFLHLLSGTAILLVASSAGVTVAVPEAAAQAASKKVNVIPETEAENIRAKIVSIDAKSREVVLEGPEGGMFTVIAGPLVRLDLLMPHDTVNAKYYRSVAFLILEAKSKNAKPSSQSALAKALATPARTASGTGLRVTEISGQVVSIDHASNTIDIADTKEGTVYSVDVIEPEDVRKLSDIAVGDTVAAVVNEALAVTIAPSPSAYFPRRHFGGSSGQGGSSGR